MGESHSTYLPPLVNNHLQAKNMDEIRDKYNSGEAQAREAFEELCAMCDAFHGERDTARETARAKVTILRERNARLRERNARMRARYAVLVDMYNGLAEEAKERSDSSSSSDSSDGEDCCIM